MEISIIGMFMNGRWIEKPIDIPAPPRYNSVCGLEGCYARVLELADRHV